MGYSALHGTDVSTRTTNSDRTTDGNEGNKTPINQALITFRGDGCSSYTTAQNVSTITNVQKGQARAVAYYKGFPTSWAPGFLIVILIFILIPSV